MSVILRFGPASLEEQLLAVTSRLRWAFPSLGPAGFSIEGDVDDEGRLLADAVVLRVGGPGREARVQLGPGGPVLRPVDGGPSVHTDRELRAWLDAA